MKNNQTIMVVVIVVLVGVVGFFGGMKYQESKSVSNRGGQFQGRFGDRQGGGLSRGGQQVRFGGAVIGEILSKDDKSITVKLQDGSSKIVLFSDSATVSKTETASKDDLKVGTKVGVFGMNNSDGSVTAQNIQINPMFRGPNGQNQPSPSPK